MNQLRESIIAQTEIIAKKTRFGLFSQPPPIALGDSSLSIKKRGKCLTTQLSVDKMESRKHCQEICWLVQIDREWEERLSLSIHPASIKKILLNNQLKSIKSIKKRYMVKLNFMKVIFVLQVEQKPCINCLLRTNSPYQHVEQKQQREKKIKRDENGRVKTEPSNIITNCMSRIRDRLFKHPEHMKDEYQRPREISRQQRIIWREKIKQEVMFRSVSHGGSTFSKDKNVYGLDQKTKGLLTRKNPTKTSQSVFAKHDTRFKLARRGHGDPIGRYPQFIEPREGKSALHSRRTKTQSIEGEKETWRPSSGFLSKPSPSINLTNLRRFI